MAEATVAVAIVMWHHDGRPCHDWEVPDPMTAVAEARNAYIEARAEVTRTRLELGRAIVEARRADISQVDIAKNLGLTREQIRRYEAEYKKWLARPGAAPATD